MVCDVDDVTMGASALSRWPARNVGDDSAHAGRRAKGMTLEYRIIPTCSRRDTTVQVTADMGRWYFAGWSSEEVVVSDEGRV